MTSGVFEKALHPDFLARLPALQEIIDMAKEMDPEPGQLQAYIDEDEEWSAAWAWAMDVVTHNRVSCLGGNAYAVPFLHPGVAENFKQLAIKLGEEHGWKPNADEETPYQIPEIVLKHCDPRLHELMAAQAKYLDVWHLILYQAVPNKVSSIQFTKYSPEDTANGNWHHDQCSDFTAVVSLNPGEFVGGGTDLKLSPTQVHAVPPLPAGYALLLNGKQLQHRGRYVEEGTRYLLTFWMESVSELA